MAHRHWLVLLILFQINLAGRYLTYASNQSQFAEAPLFSLSSGFYTGAIQIELSVASPTAIIYYTLDCSNPTDHGLLYTNPIPVTTTTTIRARTFETGLNPSNIISHTYIIDQRFKIPTLSLITDPSNLWGENGIYANPEQRGDEWERPATIEWFESDGTLGFASNAGIRIHGGTSRAFEKKSFRFYFRNEYGQSNLHYPVFQSKTGEEFKRLVASASFQDSPANSAYGSGTLLRDAVLHEIGRRIETDLALATRPIALFLNGKPWGIYNAIEHLDRFLLEINFGIPEGDIIENYSVASAGTMDHWNEMIAFFESSDLSLPQNYEQAKSFIDVQNFVRYNIVEIYAGNMDWPDDNNFAYCSRNPGAKWRWILWDLDHAFAYTNANTFELATTEELKGTIILRKLFENNDFKIYFANQLADYLNTVLLPAKVKAIIDSLAAIIRSEIYFEVDRWGGTIAEWDESVRFLKEYADYRPDRIWNYALDEFDSADRHLLTIESPQGGPGAVRVNSRHVDQYPWCGYYFDKIPIELEAIPCPGFKFKQWSDSLLKTNNVSIKIQHDYSICPIFETDTQYVNIVINEINYNSAPNFDPEDWIELYNPSIYTIDVSGWDCTDDDNAHKYYFPIGTALSAHGYLIVCRDSSAFQHLFPDVSHYIGNLNFGLSNGGDVVRIYDRSDHLVDSVKFDDASPWPTEPDGQGATLALIDPALDNTLPEDWRASPGHGSPGKPNHRPPEVISFVVRDSSGTTAFTNSREVLVEIIECDDDGKIVKWLVTENPAPPAPKDFILIQRPTSYHIIGAEGEVPLYGWVLDSNNQVSNLTPVSQARIKLDLTQPSFRITIPNSHQIEVVYDEAMVEADKNNNYKITPPLGCIMVASRGENCYLLTTAQKQTRGINYTLTVNNVTDLAGNSLTTNRCEFTGCGGKFIPVIENTLLPIFPNPFNQSTQINYQLSLPGQVRITIYNMLGNEIKVLVDERKPIGRHQISWDGRDSMGLTLPSGVYILRLESDEFTQSRKVLMIK